MNEDRESKARTREQTYAYLKRQDSPDLLSISIFFFNKTIKYVNNN